MREIYHNIRHYRRLKKLTQSELAKHADIPQPALSAIENGNRDITVSTLYKLAKALDISPERFFITQKTNHRLDRYQLDQIASQVVSGKRGLSYELNQLCDELEDLTYLKFRALGFSKSSQFHKRRKFVSTKLINLKDHYNSTIINVLLKKIDKHLLRLSS